MEVEGDERMGRGKGEDKKSGEGKDDCGRGRGRGSGVRVGVKSKNQSSRISIFGSFRLEKRRKGIANSVADFPQHEHPAGTSSHESLLLASCLPVVCLDIHILYILKHISVYLFIHPSIYLSLSIYLSIHLYFSFLFIYRSIYLSTYPSI